METRLESQIYTKLNNIENEIEELKILVTAGGVSKKKLVSLRGVAKLLVSETELDKSIEAAQKSLFKWGHDAVYS